MKLNAGTALAAVMMAIVLVTPFTGQTPKPTTNDPSIGTWVLNNQKSKLGGPAPNAFIERYELRADGFIVGTRSVVGNDSSPSFEQVAFKYDGKEYEWWDNATLADFMTTKKRTPKTLAVKSIDTYTVEYVGKDEGKVVVTGKRTISKDGKTMTFTAKAVTPQGPLDVVAVFDKR